MFGSGTQKYRYGTDPLLKIHKTYVSQISNSDSKKSFVHFDRAPGLDKSFIGLTEQKDIQAN